VLEAREASVNARKAELFDDARAKGVNVHVLKLTIQRCRLERQIRRSRMSSATTGPLGVRPIAVT
jgi:hypothetical protein